MSSAALSDEFALGNRKAEYRGAPPKTFLIVSGLLVGGGITYIGSIFLGVANFIAIVIMLIGLAICSPAIYLALVALRNRAVYIEVFANGFIDGRGSSRRIIRWDEIDTVYQKLVVGETFRYTLHLSGGRKLIYNESVKEILKFGRIIQDEVTARKLPAALQVLNNGKLQTFGKLTIGKDGINRGKHEVFWRDIEKVWVNNAVINIKPNGADLGTGWLTQKIADTPNAYVLLGLLDHKVGIQK